MTSPRDPSAPAAPAAGGTPATPEDLLAGLGSWRAVLTPRRVLVALLGALAGGLALLAFRGPAQTFADALGHAASAQPEWVAAAVGLEVVSIAGYVALLWLVSGAGARASYRIALGGAAVTRLLPTGGAGGIAFSVWALRRTGRSTAGASAVLLRFLVLLYAVFLLALAVGGALVATGAAGDAGTPLLGAIPAAGAAAAVALGLVLAAAHGILARSRGRVTRAGAALGGAVREALGVLRTGDPRLTGAVLWWGADLAVLWATLHAVGSPPALPVLLLGYFLGAVANTLPVPGAASGGTIGALVALGVEPDVALAAVLAHRAIAIWLPVPFGAAALVALRRDPAPERRTGAPARTLRLRRPVPAPLPAPA